MTRWNSEMIRREIIGLASSGKFKSAKKLAAFSKHASSTVYKILKENNIVLCKRGKYIEPKILELINSGKYTNAKQISDISFLKKCTIR